MGISLGNATPDDMSGKVITNVVSNSNDTPTKKPKEKVDKYLTIILKYKEIKDTEYPSVIYVADEIIQAIKHYNINRPYGDNSRFELFGLYIDDDDPERQNIINQEEKNKLED